VWEGVRGCWNVQRECGRANLGGVLVLEGDALFGALPLCLLHLLAVRLGVVLREGFILLLLVLRLVLPRYLPPPPIYGIISYVVYRQGFIVYERRSSFP